MAKLKGRAYALSREIEKPWEISPCQDCPGEWGPWQIHWRQSGIFGFSEVRISRAAVKTGRKNLAFLAFLYRLTDAGAAQNLMGLFNFSGLSCCLMRDVSARCIGHGTGEGPSRCGLSRAVCCGHRPSNSSGSQPACRLSLEAWADPWGQPLTLVLDQIPKAQRLGLPSPDTWEQLINCTFIHTQMHAGPKEWDQEWAMAYHGPLHALEEALWLIWWGRLGAVSVHCLWDVRAQEDARALLQESCLCERERLSLWRTAALASWCQSL